MYITHSDSLAIRAWAESYININESRINIFTKIWQRFPQNTTEVVILLNVMMLELYLENERRGSNGVF